MRTEGDKEKVMTRIGTRHLRKINDMAKEFTGRELIELLERDLIER
jgi:hypothetical protein